MRLKTTFEPPSAMEMFCAVVIETGVMVTIMRTEGLVVMVFSKRHRISRVATVSMYMKSLKIKKYIIANNIII